MTGTPPVASPLGPLFDPSSVVAILRTLAQTTRPVTADQLASTAGSEVAAVWTMVHWLFPFGVLDYQEGAIEVRAGHARLFLQSYARCIEEGAVLIDDWQRSGAVCAEPDEMLERGVCLIRGMEERRVKHAAAQGRIAAPIRRVRVAKGIVKGGTSAKHAYYLMLPHESSGGLAFVGGEVRNKESFELCLEREIREELPGASLRRGRDYTLEPMVEKPMSERFVSPSYGVLTEFEVSYFHVRPKRKWRLPTEHSWVTLEELLVGETRTNRRTVPPPEIVEKLAPSMRELGASQFLTINEKKVTATHQADGPATDPEKLRVRQIIDSMTVKQAWGALAAVLAAAAAIAGAGFAIGKYLPNR